MSQRTLSVSSGKQALRFLLTGSLNTALGFAVILLLLAAGASDIAANFAGYTIGLLLSFFVNRIWTFERKGWPGWREVGLFAVTFVGAYSMNLAIIVAGQGIGLSGNPLLHLTGIAVYTATFFWLSKAIVYPSSSDNTRRAIDLGLAKCWPEYVTLSVIAAILSYVLTLRLTHDVIWQFWIARQMLGGVPLYTYIMEINPPLWFWIALPLQQLGTMVGVVPDRLYIVAICMMAAWSAFATGRLLHGDSAKRRAVIMIAIALLCLLAPVYDFGQREQIAIILALPYGALLVKRLRGEPVSFHFALIIGVSAAFGFALKHYFVLMPVALELWFLWYSRNIWRSFRVETIALGLCALAYLVAIIIFTPDFFRLIVPLVSNAYQGYEKPWTEQIFRFEVLIWVFAAVAYPALRKTLEERERAVGDMLGFSVLAFAASYFLQQKGWQYHAIPATVCASLLMVHCLANQRDVIKSIAGHPAAFLAAALFLSIGLGRGPYNSDWAKPMAAILEKEAAGSSVMILTVDPRRVFPFVEDYKLIWPSRHFAHWMLSGIAHAELGYRGATMSPELARLSDDVRRQALADIKCNPPSLILSQIRNRGVVLNPKRFRMTDFFRRDPAFRDYLADNYRLEWTNRNFEAYRRVTPLLVEGSACYAISTPV